MTTKTKFKAVAVVVAIFSASSLAFAEGMTYTWNPAGANLLMSNPANWGETSVDLTSGTATLKFDQVTTDKGPVLDQDVSVYGLNYGGITSSSGYFTMSRPAGTGSALTIGAGGIVHNNSRRYHMVSVPLVIKGDQTWDMTGAYLFISDIPLVDFDPENPATITKTGTGDLGLQCIDSTFAGTFDIQNGSVQFAYRNPIAAAGKVKLGLRGSIELSYGKNIAAERKTVLPCPVDCTVYGKNGTGSLKASGGGGEISGPLTYSCEMQRTLIKITGESGNENDLILSGGVTGTGDTRIEFAGTANCKPDSIIIRNKPWVTTSALKCTGGVLHNDNSYGRIVFEVASNEFASLGYDSEGQRWSQCDIKTTVDWAFDKDDMPLYFGNNSKFDLCGTKQRIGSLTMNAGGTYYPLAVCNSSDTPATLYVKQAVDYTQDGDFEGKLNLVLYGDKTMTINRPATATGGLEVQSGALAFTANGSWKGATRLTLGADGRVGTAAGGTFGTDAALVVTTGGVLSLGGDETVMTFKLDGEPMTAGRYSKTGADGTTPCAALDGDGVLTVRYTSTLDIVDGTLTVAAGDSLTIDANVACDQPFDRIVLGDGATLTVKDTTFMPTSTKYAFELGTDATVVLPAGVEYECSSVTVAGVAQGGWITFGAGRVFANGTPVDSKWQYAGGSKSMGVADNWDREPDFASGLANLRFENVDPDIDPELSCDTFANKLTLGYVTPTPGGYHILQNPEGASYNLTIGPGGIDHNNTGRFHEILVPTYLLGDQTWAVNGADMYFGETAPIHDYMPARPPTITKTGSHNVWFEGRGGTFAGTIDVRQGGVTFAYWPNLVSSGARVNVRETGVVNVQGGTVDGAIDIDVTTTDWQKNTILGWEGYTGEIAGPITYRTAGTGCFVLGARSVTATATSRPGVLILSGGITGSGDARLGFKNISNPTDPTVMATHSTIVISNKPWVATGRIKACGEAYTTAPSHSAGKFVFAVAGNSATGIGLGNDGTNWSGADIDTTVDWAFDKSDMQVWLGARSWFDLCGTQQRVGSLIMNPYGSTEGDPVVTNSSETAATLYVNQTTQDWTQLGDFGGKLNLDISGTRTMTINRRSAAEGSLAVHGTAKLVFEAGGSWKKLTALEVTDSAKVTVTDPGTFGRRPKAVVKLASADSLSIPAGVTQPILELWIGGVKQPLGTYRFGDGYVDVGPWGMAVIVR